MVKSIVNLIIYYVVVIHRSARLMTSVTYFTTNITLALQSKKPTRDYSSDYCYVAMHMMGHCFSRGQQGHQHGDYLRLTFLYGFPDPSILA